MECEQCGKIPVQPDNLADFLKSHKKSEACIRYGGKCPETRSYWLVFDKAYSQGKYPLKEAIRIKKILERWHRTIDISTTGRPLLVSGIEVE